MHARGPKNRLLIRPRSKPDGAIFLCLFASKQGVEAPVATATRSHVQVEKTEQDGRNALVLNRRYATWCVKLPVRNRHHARKDKCDGPRSNAKHDRDPAKELEEPTDTRLRHQGR